MDLPSFIWLWRIAAWSMGLSLTVYTGLLVTGGAVWYGRSHQMSVPGASAPGTSAPGTSAPGTSVPGWLRVLHIGLGGVLVTLVLLLLSVGIIGTLGEHGSLGHSWHLGAGLFVVSLVLASAAAAAQIATRPWARTLHVAINGVLFLAFAAVSYSGWTVVQQYLP